MNRVLLSYVGILSLVAGCAAPSTRHVGHAVPVVASGAHAKRKFDIPAEDATVALNEWSRQGNMQALFDYSALRGRQTQAVEGALPPVEALQSMLKDMGLNFSLVNEKTIAITQDR